MRIGATTLKVAAGLGTAAAVAGGALAVAADPHPGAAPLKPPVAASASQLAAAAPATTSTPGGALTIPATPVCQGTKGGVAYRPPTAATPAPTVGPATPTSTAAPGPVLDPALRALVQQYRAAATRQARQQVLSSLTPDQRMQLTAAVAALRGAAAAPVQAGTVRPPVRGGTAQACRGQDGATSGGGSGSVTPTVVAGGAVKPIITTSVS